MTRDSYPDDCVTGAAFDGEDDLSLLAGEDEDEEADSHEPAGAYGSLLSLGGGMRKKKPSIVLDPVEAENEARRVQYVAAQQFIGGDEPEALEFFHDLAGYAELGEPAAVETAGEEAEVDDAAALDEDVQESVATGPDEPVTEWAAIGEEELSEDPAEIPLVIEEPAATEPAVIAWLPEFEPEFALDFDTAAEAELPAELPVMEPEPVPVQSDPAKPRPDFGHAGHSLRARMPARPRRKTAMDHLLAILVWLGERLTRRR